MKHFNYLFLGVIQFLCIAKSELTFGQVSAFEKTKQPPLGITVKGGYGLGFPGMDLKNNKHTRSTFDLQLDYKFNQELHVAAVFQTGQLSAGKNLPGLPYFVNNYYASSALLRLSLMDIQDYRPKGFKISIGVGAGFIASDVVSNPTNDPGWGPLYSYNGVNLIVPAELEISQYLVNFGKTHSQSLLIFANVRHYYSWTDKLDAYVPTVAANRNWDMFDTIILGLGYEF